MPQSMSTMQPRFDYRKFLSLSESDLVAYMEPIVNAETAIIEPADLQDIASGLGSFDEYHLVYAIELGIDSMPFLFALPVAECLTNRFQSVRLAAHRALSRLPTQAITDDLIDACHAAIAAGAPIQEVGDLPNILGRRRRMLNEGTTTWVSPGRSA
jgi:hypothetical protein